MLGKLLEGSLSRKIPVRSIELIMQGLELLLESREPRTERKKEDNI